MLKSLKKISVVICALALLAVIAVPAVKTTVRAETRETEVVALAEENQAQETSQDDAKGSKAIAAAIAVGLAAALGALAMGIAIAKSNEAIARQPEAASQIKSGLMLGLVFIETAIIYALIVAILVIFVL